MSFWINTFNEIYFPTLLAHPKNTTTSPFKNNYREDPINGLVQFSNGIQIADKDVHYANGTAIQLKHNLVCYSDHDLING